MPLRRRGTGDLGADSLLDSRLHAISTGSIRDLFNGWKKKKKRKKEKENPRLSVERMVGYSDVWSAREERVQREVGFGRLAERYTVFSTGHGEFSVFHGFNKWQVPLTRIEQ